VLMALARRAEWGATYYTSGEDGDVDVDTARALTGRLGLPYRVTTPRVVDGEDWAAATARFVGQTDGMATMVRIGDWIDHQAPARRLGLKLWGAGGEIGRGGAVASLAIPVAANTWGLRWAPGAQRRVLRAKVQAWDLFRPGVVEATAGALDRFIDARRREGWRARELLEAYNAFERVPHWASAGLRRAASATDLFSPFVTRDFVGWCFSLPAPERVVEAPHWRLLTELAPDLRDMPFERPWRPQRPRWAQTMVLRDVAKEIAGRARHRSAPASPPRPGFASRWLDAGRETSRELCLSHDRSPLWDLVDRRSLEAVLARPFEEQRRPADYWLGVCGAMTAFWWFHGRDLAGPAIAEAA